LEGVLCVLEGVLCGGAESWQKSNVWQHFLKACEMLEKCDYLLVDFLAVWWVRVSKHIYIYGSHAANVGVLDLPLLNVLRTV
jgi:hypothetical protein